MVWLHVPHILVWVLTYVPHICDIFPPQGLRVKIVNTIFILETHVHVPREYCIQMGKAIQTLMFEGWNHFFFKKVVVFTIYNFFSKIKETNLAGNRNSKFTSKNHGFFFSFVMKSKLCLTRNDKKKVDYQVQVQCIYQNIGGEGVGYCKVKKKEKLQNRLPLDQNYCPLIYTCLIYLISWTIYYFYDIIGLIVQVKPHTNMVKYFFPTEK